LDATARLFCADPHALYFANQYIYKTTNGGESWAQISQDMTREEPGVPANLNDAAAADVAPNTPQREDSASSTRLHHRLCVHR
jgi:hypothetical protein